jgi:hypothetical protein
VGFTAVLLMGAKLAGCDISAEVAAASVIGGIFLDGDKAVEIVVNREKAKRGQIPDITARCRILHSIFAFPFGLVLSFAVGSLLPFIAVVLHIFADSFIPGIIGKDGKNYPSHSCRKWLANPFSQKSWAKVAIGWPVIYPPKFNWIYEKLAPAVGLLLMIFSFWFWYYIIIR